MLTCNTLSAVLDQWQSTHLDKEQLALQESAMKMFETLKSQGLATNRGNCLQDATERYRYTANGNF